MVKPSWLKEKGYLHLSPSLELGTNSDQILRKVTSKKYVESYAFYPLIHTVISDRKFKKGSSKKHTTTERKHTHYRLKTLQPVKNAKVTVVELIRAHRHVQPDQEAQVGFI